MTDIFHEIEEELRRDNFKKLWAKYGRYLIAVAVAALVIAGGFALWRNHEAAQQRAQSRQYAEAFVLAGTGKKADAAKVFGTIAQEGGGYALLARFEQAALLAETGKIKAALAIYHRLAHASDIDPTFRGLAALRAAMLEKNPQTRIELLKPLAAKGSPWRPTALELTALARLETGDRAGALTIFRNLSLDPTTPARLKARAAEMAKALRSS